MRLLRFLPLMGIREPTKSGPSTDVEQLPTTTAHNVVQNKLHHHNHQHAHLHPTHPTQQARLAHLKVKDAAYERIRGDLQTKQKILEEREVAFRPLIFTNHLTDETVYPAYSSVEQSGGLELPPGTTVTVKLPTGQLDSFRSWIRRGCTKGVGENDLKCLTGDCNGKLVCDGWGNYGSSQLETAIFPSTQSMWPDFSNVEGSTMLPITFTVDGCLQLSCDPTGIDCPVGMQVKDENGKILACSCGYSDWVHLQSDCPDSGGAEIQNAVHAACPDIYSYAQSDSYGQKYCPYDETNAIRIDVGVKHNEPDVQSQANQQIVKPEKNEEDDEQKVDQHAKSSQTTPTVTFENWWTDTPEWKAWADKGYPK